MGEVASRISEFYTLTTNPGSDMSELLARISQGRTSYFRGALFEDTKGRLIGWTAVYVLVGQKAMDVFVLPSHRRSGLGKRLVEEMLKDETEKLLVSNARKFWARFPGRLVFFEDVYSVRKP
jgi:GNAT superfamily N-acetyltransferase